MVALHVGALAGDGGDRQAVARTGVAASEDACALAFASAHVLGEEVRLLGRNPCAFAVGDFPAGRKRSGFTGQRDLHSLFGADAPGVEQVQIGPLVGHVFFIGQTGHRVLGREAGDVVSGLNRLAHRIG